MGPIGRMHRRSEFTAALMLAALVVWQAGAAMALSLPHPEPPRRLTVQATMKGKLGNGRKVNFRVVATDPQSWFHLKSVKMSLLLHGFTIQDVEFFVGDQTINTTGLSRVKFGGRPLAGSFLRIINGNTSRFVRQTFSVTLTFWAKVTESIPGDVRLRLLATDQDGNTSRATDRVPVFNGLLSWGMVALVGGAMLALGGFLGRTVTSRRYRQREPSIWQILERRLKEQRARPPTPVAVLGAPERVG